MISKQIKRYSLLLSHGEGLLRRKKKNEKNVVLYFKSYIKVIQFHYNRLRL